MNNLSKTMVSVSVIIPTYNRESVLIDTLNDLLSLPYLADEIIVVDQTRQHQPETDEMLAHWHSAKRIKWFRLEQPSVTRAMNFGARHASGDVLLFLDDDIKPDSQLIRCHAAEYAEPDTSAVAGQVIQSWQTELPADHSSYINGCSDDPDAFLFNSSNKAKIKRFIGANVSFDRNKFLAAGGFDQNFKQVAYRFEAEFAARWIRLGESITYQPKASLAHLKAADGGTRAFGDHQRTLRPSHSVGHYYYMLTVAEQKHRWRRFFWSPLRACVSRFHLSHPWWIPMTFAAEISGMIWAIILRAKGQSLMEIS